MRQIVEVVLFAAFFAGNILSANSQEISFDKNNQTDFIPSSNVFKFGNKYISFAQGEVKNQMGRFKLSKEKFQLSLYMQDRQMKLIGSIPLSNDERIYGPFDASLQQINNKLYLVYFQMAEGDDAGPIHIMAGEVDTVNLGLKNPKEILTVDYKKRPSVFIVANTLSTDRLRITQSPDKSKILVAWASGNENKYFYSVLDLQMNSLWSKAGTVGNDPELKAFLSGSCVDNSENVYLGFTGKIETGPENGHVVVCTRSNNGKDLIMPIPDGQAAEVHCISSNDKTVKIVGAYHVNSPNLTGVFSASLKVTDNKISGVKLTPFTPEFLSDLKNEEWEWSFTKGKYIGMVDCLESDTYALEDGSIQMAGQLYRYHSTSSSGYFIRGSIISIWFKNGETTITRIPRYSSYALNDFANGFFIAIKKDQSIIFVNELKQNLDGKHTFKYETHTSEDIVLCAITIADGKVVKKEMVTDLQNENMVAIPRFAAIVSDNEVMIPFQKLKKFGRSEKVGKGVFVKF